MGICNQTSASRDRKQLNRSLKLFIAEKIEEQRGFSFFGSLAARTRRLAPQHLITEEIINAVEFLENMSAQAETNYPDKLSNMIDSIQEDSIVVQDICLRGPQSGIKSSFQRNVESHQSLIVQIDLIYGVEIPQNQYKRSLALFAKWAQLFTRHIQRGLLSPFFEELTEWSNRQRSIHIDKEQYGSTTSLADITKQSLSKMDQAAIQRFQSIAQEFKSFIWMISCITIEVYRLKTLAKTESGELLRTQNIYNLIMSMVFKKGDICLVIKESLHNKLEQKTHVLANKLPNLIHSYPVDFGVERKFQLALLMEPYGKTVKIMKEIRSCVTPLGKLRRLVSVSKSIAKQLRQYYQTNHPCEPVPNLDSDSLMGIAMYLVAKSQTDALLQDLQLASYFTTTNCLNCISGYYLNLFEAAVTMLLER